MLSTTKNGRVVVEKLEEGNQVCDTLHEFPAVFYDLNLCWKGFPIAFDRAIYGTKKWGGCRETGLGRDIRHIRNISMTFPPIFILAICAYRCSQQLSSALSTTKNCNAFGISPWVSWHFLCSQFVLTDSVWSHCSTKNGTGLYRNWKGRWATWRIGRIFVPTFFFNLHLLLLDFNCAIKDENGAVVMEKLHGSEGCITLDISLSFVQIVPLQSFCPVNFESQIPQWTAHHHQNTPPSPPWTMAIWALGWKQGMPL